jgi:sugar phosphate isomerase/epimerase
MPRIAVQLWTVRTECERDLEGALARLGEQGYDGVELFQLHGRDAAEVRALADAAGLVVAGRHVPLETLEADMAQIAADAEALGTRRVAIGWIDPQWLERPLEVVDRVREAAERARNAGLRLGFHNHWSEVEPLDGGGTFLDLLRRLPAELLWLELDLGWVWHGGADPQRELRASAGRCPLVHIKDFAGRYERPVDVPVGEGVVGYGEVVPAALAAGAEWLVVEQDEPGDDPFGATERSLLHVRELIA